MATVGEFFTKPRVWLRSAAVLCAIIVFGCIADKGWYDASREGYGNICVFNGKADACRFGLATGIIAFLALLAFNLLEFLFVVDSLHESARRPVNIVELGFSALWTLMWFTSFVFLADTWRKTNANGLSTGTKNNARAAIAFSFFSFIIFISYIILNVRNFKEGESIPYEQPQEAPAGGYGGSAEPYQEPSAAEAY